MFKFCWKLKVVFSVYSVCVSDGISKLIVHVSFCKAGYFLVALNSLVTYQV